VVTSSGLVVEILAARVEHVDADALLLPVDGTICRLGGATAGALRAALTPEERAEELEYLEDELARLRPLPHPQARAIDGVARWKTIIVSAAYPHNVDGIVYSQMTARACCAPRSRWQSQLRPSLASHRSRPR
jgi:hypothetical protein